MKRQWATVTGALLVWGTLACSGDAKSSGTTDGSDTGSDGSGGASGDSTGTGGSGTGGDGGTGGDTDGQASGTGGTDSASCPSVEPAIGASCAPEGQRCAFINCVAPDYRDDHTLACFDGAWALTAEAICDEEPSSCPSTAPVLGQACDVASTPGPCTAIDACGSVRVAYCTANVWVYEAGGDGENGDMPAAGGATVVSTATPSSTGTTGAVPEPAACPVNPPALGTPCCPADYPEVCDYGASSSGGASGFAVPMATGGASSTAASTPTSTVVATVTTATVTTGNLVTSGTTGDTVTGGTVTGGTVTGGTVTGGTVTGGTVTGSTVTGGTSAGTGGFSGGGGGPSDSVCVACSADLVWEASSDCP